LDGEHGDDRLVQVEILVAYPLPTLTEEPAVRKALTVATR
jgi:hypothetical protein